MIELKNVSKAFRKHVILRPTHLTLHSGINAMIGLNGTGKTTLLKMLSGIIKSDEGQIAYNQQTIRSTISKIGVAFDLPSFYGHLSGWQNMVYFNQFQQSPVSVDDLKKIATEWNVPLDKRRTSKYSLGKKKRLSLALSLIGNPEFWFLDEPFNGLDFESKEQLTAKIEQFRRKKKTILLISHDLNLCLNLADQLLFMHHGELHYLPNQEPLLNQVIFTIIHIEKCQIPSSIQRLIVEQAEEHNGLRLVIMKQDERQILCALNERRISILGLEHKIPSISQAIKILHNRIGGENNVEY
ncbi:lantibiotic transport ATP-binding protein srtF [Sporolactobacillus inulinus]|uniref:Lantibiotic transport ATP-binding protein srtF n=1 Tax=Sporolactobacillus inulinus TaxID=2078 RepID=A0A4Y1Z667_9BACL|nr:ABC transporter ATP-binding protein [Sporolactobacillus inulinus]GAY74449.1 lantibiotic transport ATP-binding protein srtF [Sporolactobacillus inulinus]